MTLEPMLHEEKEAGQRPGGPEAQRKPGLLDCGQALFVAAFWFENRLSCRAFARGPTPARSASAGARESAEDAPAEELEAVLAEYRQSLLAAYTRLGWSWRGRLCPGRPGVGKGGGGNGCSRSGDVLGGSSSQTTGRGSDRPRQAKDLQKQQLSPLDT